MRTQPSARGVNHADRRPDRSACKGPSLAEQSFQHFAPCRGLAAKFQRCVEVAIGTDNVSLDPVIVGVAAVFGLHLGVTASNSVAAAAVAVTLPVRAVIPRLKELT